jgi:hypothetical protein
MLAAAGHHRVSTFGSRRVRCFRLGIGFLLLRHDEGGRSACGGNNVLSEAANKLAQQMQMNAVLGHLKVNGNNKVNVEQQVSSNISNSSSNGPTSATFPSPLP